MKTNLDIGYAGEEHASRYLMQKGYLILERNWRSGRNEVDIIAKDAYGLVIVEVKTRKKNSLVLAEASVDKHKQQRLLKAATAYIYDNDWNGECRFDVVVVEMDGPEKFTIRHFEDAFFPNPTDEL
jgi:putative endonuclease